MNVVSGQITRFEKKHRKSGKMITRKFIFCDGCNLKGIRMSCANDLHDKRNADGCSSYESTLDDAINLGWQLSEQGDILCPYCVENGVTRLLIDDRWCSNEIKHSINKYKQAHDNK